MEKKELQDSFEKYTDLVCRTLKSQYPKVDRTGPRTLFRLIPNPHRELRERVSQLVKGDSFLELVKKSRKVFSEFEDVLAYTVSPSCDQYFTEEDEWDIDELFRFAVHNFFCRSGFYMKVSKKLEVNIHDLFERFCLAFQKKAFKTTFLAPMEGVRFSDNMKFGDFQIRTFKEDELERIFNNDIKKIFYPEVSFNNKILTKFWFIAVEDVESLSEIKDLFWSNTNAISPQYTIFPKRIEAVLRPIILYDWKVATLPPLNKEDYLKLGFSYEEDKHLIIESGWPHYLDKFNIPFVLKEDDNLLAFPNKNEPLAGLQVHGFKVDSLRNYYPLKYDKKKTKHFKRFIAKTEKQIDNLHLDSDELEYVNIAIGYLMKAFFSENLEELIFNIITIEALVGEKGKEVTEKLRKRVSVILGNTEKERKKIRQEFDELYEFRCQLVHGTKFKKPIYQDHLRKAREFSRKTLLWYLHCLNFVKVKSKHLPARSDILTLVDLEKGYIRVLKDLLRSLPKGFPNIANWVVDS